MAPDRTRRIEWRLFAAFWLAYAFFHQGGGWNQNARFAMLRSVVETGRLDVDATLVYGGVDLSPSGPVLRRAPVERGAVSVAGRRWLLAWPGSPPRPVREPAEDEEIVALDRVAATGDLAYAGDHFYPNKAPGTALLALPAYFALHGVERLLGLDPDDWWVLTTNAWLTSALSVALVSALACLLFRRVALLLWPDAGPAATAATLAFGFGTLFFPYATMLFEQNVAAAGLLASFWLLERARADATARRVTAGAALAGIAAGWAAISSYVAALPVLLLAGSAAMAPRRPRLLAGFALGVAGPLLVAGVYHQLCYGSPFTTAYAHQSPLFREGGALLGVLGWPRLDRLVGVLVSPYRGLFASSPVLVIGAIGLVWMWRDPGQRRHAVLFLAVFGSLLLFNVCFNGWHGGWGVGPRYLIPALPFVALPLTQGFRRWPRSTAALALLSGAIMTLFTAVDAQPPVGASPIAERPGRPLLLRDPLGEYALPIFLTGRAGPILEAQRGAQGSVQASALELFHGPVSANPIGAYEAWIGRALPPDAPEAGWNSFNAGELLWPGSRISLLPLLVPALLAAAALREATRAGRSPPA